MGMGRDGSPGSAGLHLAAGVPLLHPDEQVFAAMLEGWRARQLARNLALATAGRREAMVRAFAVHADAFPWQWGPGMVDEWLGELRGVKGLRRSTIRSYASSVSAFCWYVTDPAYGWAGQCQARFGTHPVQVEYGVCQVRFGKAMKGSPPKHRSVLTVWEWVPEVLGQWIAEARPLMPAAGESAALWPSERGPRIGSGALHKRLCDYRDALGLDEGLDFHPLRRSYVTHLIEGGWDPLFVQQQAGHEHASTTAIYTCVSSDFRTRTLRRALDATADAAMRPGRSA